MDTSRPRRTPLVLGIVVGLLAVAVAIALVIAANRGPAESDPPPPSTPAPAPTTPAPATSTPATPTVAEVAFEERGFVLRAEDGSEVFTFRWEHEPSEVIAALSDAFGAEPAVGFIAGDGSHYPDYTLWEWPGFTLAGMVETEDGKPREEYARPSFVSLTANSLGEISLTPEFGLRVGMSADEARTSAPDLEEDLREYDGGVQFVYGMDRGSFPTQEGMPATPSYAVFAETGPDGATIERIDYSFWSEL